MPSPRIGIALGSGSSRGWAHIGVLRALAEMGIHPEIVCGCSVGSIVGAAYAAGNLDALESWVLSLSRLELMRFFELNVSLNGFVKRDKLQQFFHSHVCDETLLIGELPHAFATVSTNLENGRELWFSEGLVMDAVWASIALPGLFPPFRHRGQWLVDGGLVNPVPVSLCRALGAEVVIAVNLNGNVARRYAHHTQKARVDKKAVQPASAKPEGLVDSLAASLREYSSALLPDSSRDKEYVPGLMDALAASINIMQDKITRSRMAGDPPEILLVPRLENIGLLEFFRAEEAISEGRAVVGRMQAEINGLLEL
ncbi:patatin-like phospholipase family protein [Candidatus Thiothrix sp. Deng01]|uniref:Patatin-like phospholipase family protein n=1 Tax=Candidatus Thiothrix phosphatis TaxID=3112415 RepID=A0ABU6D570_9GAMM|nr:patatin-like phospholipase family protein [Candidatus Thiothrix sp. Deng01]MEB4593449.1 patatin-like phospholipase family protein [Candidatus Thiothrix sp. Deng01]